MSGDTSTTHERPDGGRWPTMGKGGRRRWLPVLVAALLLVPLGPLARGDTASNGGTWALTGSMDTMRTFATATLLPSGQVLVAGGETSATGQTARAELYDPSTGTWTATGSLSIARWGHTATLLPSGQVLVAGGLRCCASNNSSFLTLASAELYDPHTGTWTATGSLDISRGYHTATLLPDGQVLVAGGYHYLNVYLASAELYNPRTHTWRATGGMALRRDGHTATLLPTGQVLIAGGIGRAGAEAERYDPSTGTWTVTGSMTTARYNATAALLPTGQVLVAGGYGNVGTLSSAEVYDPTSGTWAPTGSMITGREAPTASRMTDGRVLVAGGSDQKGSPIGSAEVYDPRMQTWTSTASMAIARFGQTATLLPSGQLLVAGGCCDSGGNVLASAEQYTLTPPVPTLLITPSSGAYEQPITLTGSNFGPSEQVTIYVNTTQSSPVFTATTDGTGSFVLKGPVWQGHYGLHQVIAVGQSSGLTALARFFLTPSLTLTPNAGAAGSQTTVAGYDFGATERVVWHWGSPTGLVLGTMSSNGLGSTAAVTVTVPATATSGVYQVFGVGQSSGAQAGAGFTVP